MAAHWRPDDIPTTPSQVSQPLLNASWEHTAAKLYLPDKASNFQQLKFSPSGTFLAAFGGSSVFRHLGIFLIQPDAKDQNLVAIGEVRPSKRVGSLQARAPAVVAAVAAAAAAVVVALLWRRRRCSGSIGHVELILS